ncbi:hypothetical protein AB4Z21_09935 [Paenibacillus sp. MCAF20]
MNQLIVYDAPKGAASNDDFMVSVRVPGGEWQELFVYEAKVDMHNVRRASMVYFDMDGTVEVAILSKHLVVEQVTIRPLSYDIPFEQQGNRVIFKLDRPRKLAIEVNGERFANLHVFANKIDQAPPQPTDPNVLMLKPAIHRTEDIYRLAATPNETSGKAPDTIYFAPGMHYLEETLLRIPSGTTVYVAGGAVVVGSFLCDNVKNVTIKGRGIVYLSDFHRFSAFRGVRIVFSSDIMIGTHGDYHKNGDTIENIVFENIDILEHHEPQPNYWGAMAINAGDKNTVRNVKYSNIRVEDFELGQLFDIRVVWNKDYNPVAGNRIENVEFRDITYNGRNENPSRIYGFDEERIAADIRFINVRINDKLVTDAESGNFDLNDFVKDVSFG